MTDQTEEVAVPVDYLLGLTERLAQFEWQPIETAPKDGTNILLLMAGDNVPIVGMWNDLTRAWDDGDWHSNMTGFSYWMPLPEPPVGSGQNLADATP